MFCEKCGKEIGNEANFCSNCGTPQSNEKTINIETGKSSINIGVGNLPNSNIHIGDKVTKGEEPIVYEMNKTSNHRLPIKASWAVFAGVIGFIGSVARIYSVLSDGIFVSTQQNDWFFPLMPISMLLLIFGVFLLRSKFLWLQFFGFRLDEEGYVTFIRLKGKCPLCTGDLNVRYSGPEGARSIGALCTRNPEQHRFTFDPTWLDKL